MTKTVTEEQALEVLQKVLKQGRMIAEHKGESVRISCVVVQMAQANDLKLQLGDGTFELVCSKFMHRLEDFIQEKDVLLPLSESRALLIMRGITSIDHMQLAADKLKRLTTPPISVVNSSILVKATAGFALTQAGDLTATQLYSCALSAFERTTDENRFAVYNPLEKSEDSGDYEVARELEEALHQGEVQPYFEPIMGLKFNTIDAAATRMVWHSPKRGPVPFESVLEQADDAELTAPITWQFLKGVIGQLSHWDESIGAVVPVHASIFSDMEIVQQVEDALSIYNLSAGRLTIEAPEVALLAPESRQALGHLRESNVRVRIRHLGTGGMPLEAMGSLPVDETSFSPELLGKNTPPKIKQHIFTLFDLAGIDRVALNIRERKFIGRYKDLGFKYAQGPLFGEPMRSEAFTKWLKMKVGAVG